MGISDPMNEELFKALKLIHDTCNKSSMCDECPMFNPDADDACGLIVEPCDWDLDDGKRVDWGE